MRIISTIKDLTKELLDSNKILVTVEEVKKKGYISDDIYKNITSNLDKWTLESKYIISNLAVHIGILVFRYTFFQIPIPFVAPAMRSAWTLGNRVYYQIKGDKEKAKIHSWKVFLATNIPYIGALAYILPLKEKNEYLPYIYAQHICFMKKGKSLEEVLENSSGFRKRRLKMLIPEIIRKSKHISIITVNAPHSSDGDLTKRVEEALNSYLYVPLVWDKSYRVDKSQVERISNDVLDVMLQDRFIKRPKPNDEVRAIALKKISSFVKKSKPIGLSVGFNGVKNLNAVDYNKADLAELFSFYQLVNLNNAIQEVYEPGTDIRIAADDFIQMKVNNVKKTVTEEYIKSLEHLINSLGIDSVITGVKKVSTYKALILPHYFRARKAVAKFEANPENVEMIEMTRVHARRNLYFESGESEQEKEAIIRRAAHEYLVFWSALQLSKIAKLQPRLLLMYNKREGFIQINTVYKGNITQPWQGEGCLEDIKGKLIPQVLTQLRRDIYNIKHVYGISIKGLEHIKEIKVVKNTEYGI